MITEWNSLDTIGPKGKAFKQDKEYLNQAKDFLHRHASETGLALSIFTLALAVV